MSDIRNHIDGVVIGVFLGMGEAGPLVVFPGNPEETALVARSLTDLSSDMIGTEVALLFEGADLRKPLIVGRLKVVANERLELRCGKATIVMESDGHITIRGTYLVSHASAANRIRGGSVNLN